MKEYHKMYFAFIVSLIMALSPAQQEVMAHWLDTDTYADYTNDHISNLADFALAANSDVLLSQGVVWGGDDAAFKHNSWIYICEASQRLIEMDAESMEYELLMQILNTWSQVYYQKDLN
jgi:hypothetical protein